MTLIPDWRDVLHHWSLWLCSGAAFILGLWALLPDETRSLFPSPFRELFPLVLLLASMAAKFIPQKKLACRKEARDAPTN